ncbi:MAG: prolyl oligopeptidase family serine peptidase [Pseudomonadota bacterium]|nr:prolyl oligopeptidase family serine peptidase [Pseudomonadota bacterium]
MKVLPLSAAVAAVLAMAALPPATAQSAKESAMSAPAPADAHQWLEDVEGEKQLAWVRERNAVSNKALADNAGFRQLEAELLAILNSDAKIPGVYKMGDYYYNFWQDKQHERGIWRRTTLAEYRKPNPQWETVLDLDALNKAEGENWVWHGAQCLRPAYTRCLVALSRGGADADVTREFDLASKTFVEGGFFRPEAKGSLGWIDENTVFVQTDFGPGTTTDSGYPRQTKIWKRGTPLASAELVFEGKPTDMYISAFHDDTPGYERDFVSNTVAFYNNELYLRGQDGSLTKVDVPNSVEKGVHREWLTLEPRQDWTVGGKTYKAGSYLVANFNDWMAGKRELTVLFEPSDNSSLASAAWTRNHLVLNVLEDVKNTLTVLTPTANGWQRSAFVGAPEIGTVNVGAVDSDESDALWMTASGYTTPTTLYLAEIGKQPEALKTMPRFFNAEDLQVEQHFAASKDGTRVPYFMVHKKGMKLDGSNPTLLYGYGGFEISLTPGYSGTIGKGWLEKGGVYVVANIRGGGEYGPRWHQAALKQNRHKAYEDFAAVAQDLVARNITRPAHLGVQGGSNGGLLTGNMLTQYPELFGAVVIQVPLLDMRRYNQLLAGASWMAEYGNPDKPEEWAYIQKFSPYHLFDASRNYPPVLITTSTRDDRVHPGHARKMAALMESANKNVLYYENIEGGHGGAANNAQRAHMTALVYAFLWNALSKK